MANNLNIFRASAGSGKTHKLTGFFLELMFNEDINFNEILAVTFTNKATAEMKGRIIEQLNLLSETPEKSDYLSALSQNGKRNNNYIKTVAKDKLGKILNEYADFNISTIDSFFQRVVRDLARELNVAGGLELELDSEAAIQEGVRRFLASLNDRENKEKLKWMIDFSNHVIEEGSGWDFRNDLLSLAKSMLNSEEFKQYRNEIEEFASNRKYIDEYSDRLKSIVKTWKSDLKSAAEQALDAIRAMGITINDFYYGTSSGLAILNSWANNDFSGELPKRFIEKAENRDKWFKKEKGQTYPDSPKLQELLQLCVTLADKNSKRYRNYLTAVHILDNFHQLCIMADLDRHMKDYCDEEGIMLLSSTPELLARLVKDDDAPFIYEKIGTKLRSYMIDEFQDTSQLQWTNFKPLLNEAVGQSTKNLIVGDVKQSIYRWRGGDWRLLDHEILHFHPEQQEVNDKDLRCNYRSEATVVDFNNKFFKALATSLDDRCNTKEVSRIYENVAQEFAPKKRDKFAADGVTRPGLVEITLFDVPKGEKDIDIAMSMLPEQVRKLQGMGYALKDIAVLCRRNKECEAAAKALLQSGIDIISNEALVISARPVIQAIISQLEFIQDPKSAVAKAVADYNMENIETMPMEPGRTDAPLYEMCQGIINALPAKILKSEEPFIEAFLDLILDYTSKNNGSLQAFLDWWETSGKKKSIATSDEQDAVSIMSIHKSKGLGMPAVIVPFAAWEMDINTQHGGDLIWCEPTVEPFITPCKVHLPITTSKELSNTIFADEFAEERLCSIIDNVNTAYVAFTRAKQALIIMAPKSGSKKDASTLNVFLSDYTDGESKTYGTMEGVELPKRNESQVTANISGDGKDAPVPSTTLPDLVMRHENTNEARERGNMIHRALQDVTDIETMPEAVHRLYHCEVLSEDAMPEAEMLELLTEKLSQPEIAPWFANGNNVMNEMSLIDKDGSVHRPDRVIIDGKHVTVIDYKTGSDHKGYRPQVARYMRILKQMGFTKVSGYLWFIETDNVVEVQMYSKPRQTEIEWSFE